MQYTPCSRSPDLFQLRSIKYTATDKILFQVLSSTGYREMEFTALKVIILIINISQLFTPGLSLDTMHSVHHRDLLLITLIVVKYRSPLNVL